jgi:hypothetical protein
MIAILNDCRVDIAMISQECIDQLADFTADPQPSP